MFFVIGVGTGICFVAREWAFAVAGERLTLRLRGLCLSHMLHMVSRDGGWCVVNPHLAAVLVCRAVAQDMAWFDQDTNNSRILAARLSNDAEHVRGAVVYNWGLIVRVLLWACPSCVIERRIVCARFARRFKSFPRLCAVWLSASSAGACAA
jgi:hypothetical protein